jgi:5-(aminomethyl)-3-furanmethanol phosphate kinase
MSLDAILKVGGSLSRGTRLRALCRGIGILGNDHSLIVVPGGGDFAEQVRKADRQYQLSDSTAHFMALLAMDQYGYLLSHLIEGSRVTADISVACESAESGSVAILLPSTLIFGEDPLPHSWQVTSDTIAAWISSQTCSKRLILLKDVDGLLASGQLIREMTVDQLKQHTGGVDEYLSKFLESVRLETWVLSGLHPERLEELLQTGHTTGTRIL